MNLGTYERNNCVLMQNLSKTLVKIACWHRASQLLPWVAACLFMSPNIFSELLLSVKIQPSLSHLGSSLNHSTCTDQCFTTALQTQICLGFFGLLEKLLCLILVGPFILAWFQWSQYLCSTNSICAVLFRILPDKTLVPVETSGKFFLN